MWWKSHLRHLLLDFHAPDERPYSLQNLDPKAIADALEYAHVNVLYIQGKDNQGKTYYSSNIGQKHKRLGERDLFAEFVDALQPKGIKLVASMNSTRDKLAYDLNPGWRQKWRDGSARGGSQENPDWDNMCPNSPYRFYFEALVGEICEKYQIDGVWLDHPDFGGIYPDYSCYCEHCKDKFYAEFRKDIPAGPESSLWEDFERWRRREIQAYLSECAQVARVARPGIGISFNYLGWLDAFTLWANAQDLERIADFADFLSPEIHGEREGTIVPSLSTQFVRAASGGKPSAVGVFRFTGDYDFTVKPKAHFTAEVLTAMANGGGVMVVDQVYPDGGIEPAGMELARAAYSVVEQCEDWVLDADRLPYAAVLFSCRTRRTFARESPVDYLDDFQGVVEALTEAQVPFELVTDRELTRGGLSRFSVLVLPSVVALSGEEVAAIRTFVKQGGGLVATSLTSLADGEGRVGGDFALADVFGLSFGGLLEAPYSYIRPELTQDELFSDVGDGPLMFRDRLAKVSTVSARVVAPVTDPDWGFGTVSGKPHLHPPKATASLHPAIAKNEFGDGRVVYFAGAAGAVYQRWGYPAFKGLLSGAVTWAASSPPPVTVQAPESVEMTVFEQRDRKRLIIHLVNFQTDSGRDAKVVTRRFYG